MPVEVFQDSMELAVPVLDAIKSQNTYPYPSLKDSGHVAQRIFPTVALENSFLKVQIVPDLGGRVLSIFDKRFGKELLPLPQRLAVSPCPSQGVELPFGIEFSWVDHSRAGSMDPIAFQVDEAGGAILLSEVGSTGRSWHLRISLDEAAALIHFEARILNRTFEATVYDSGLLARTGPGNDAMGKSVLVCRPLDRSRGLNRLGRRVDGVGWLNGRQVDEWSATVMPIANLDFGAVASGGIALEIANGNVRLETANPRSVEVVLGIGEGTVEATAQLYPEQTVELPFGESVPIGAVILQEGEELVRWPDRECPLLGTPPHHLSLNPDLEAGTLDPAIRHLIYAKRAIRRFVAKDAIAADQELEKALTFNAEDHLLWWAKAVAQRHQGNLDVPELENAHFLAPLEPALRAEALLRQLQSDSDQPSPLLLPLANHPDELVEISALYIEHGLLQDASRFIGEALKHIDLRILRYLLAYCLLAGAEMDAEAAVQVAAAARADGSILPWRQIELTALERLSGRFEDATLRDTLQFWRERSREK